MILLDRQTAGLHGATIEAVHRAMNERTLRRATELGRTAMRFECECHRAECASSFPISLDAYEYVRASGRRFVVTPEHQQHDESIVRAHPLYMVIEKTGRQAHAAEALNPR